ncbi:MAG: hypothetical protein JOZ20_01040 [Sphingomonas sp.]|nr:hypothetical protein [Sphingomonas sp.]
MKIIIAIAALAASLSAPRLDAQPAPGTIHEPDVTRAQAKERADQLFDQFDLNHDGYVTRQEAERLGSKLMLLRASTGRDEAPGIGGHTLRFLRHRFTGLQAVTKPQFEAAFLAHFDQMDVNHDGILTASERVEAR